ncbi:hypothetical protein CWI37_0732p0020 [Hamiltosporidium tvaerminnensis]|uniref:Uncharacterized protein n=1 Tax=Hamiltosporidium tvaerminnensis TaxID=1176355 RepID=A0A4Q9L2K4_9MICR|nr:hypothetical protein CWI37_0732p0020 [Hamiltosporidium tvaerminnensis]
MKISLGKPNEIFPSFLKYLDTRIKTDDKIRCNRPDIHILDKRKNKQTLVEDRIAFQDSLQTVETDKIRNYDLLANELASLSVILGAEMHKQPTPPLKQVDNEEDCERTINANEESVEIMERIYLEKEKFVSPDFN